MRCPNCDSDVFIHRPHTFSPVIRRQEIKVILECFVCVQCGTPLMNTGEMNMLRKLSADKYRELNGLLTSTEIKELRKDMNMSQSDFSKHLKVGIASIKRWETYYVQDAGLNDHIKSKCNKKLKPKQKVKDNG